MSASINNTAPPLSRHGRCSTFESEFSQAPSHIKQLVYNTAAVLEGFDYDSEDVFALVKKFKGDPVRVQEEVDRIFQNRNGHQLSEWQSVTRKQNRKQVDTPSNDARRQSARGGRGGTRGRGGGNRGGARKSPTVANNDIDGREEGTQKCDVRDNETTTHETHGKQPTERREPNNERRPFNNEKPSNNESSYTNERPPNSERPSNNDRFNERPPPNNEAPQDIFSQKKSNDVANVASSSWARIVAGQDVPVVEPTRPPVEQRRRSQGLNDPIGAPVDPVRPSVPPPTWDSATRVLTPLPAAVMIDPTTAAGRTDGPFPRSVQRVVPEALSYPSPMLPPGLSNGFTPSGFSQVPSQQAMYGLLPYGRPAFQVPQFTHETDDPGMTKGPAIHGGGHVQSNVDRSMLMMVVPPHQATHEDINQREVLHSSAAGDPSQYYYAYNPAPMGDGTGYYSPCPTGSVMPTMPYPPTSSNNPPLNNNTHHMGNVSAAMHHQSWAQTSNRINLQPATAPKLVFLRNSNAPEAPFPQQVNAQPRSSSSQMHYWRRTAPVDSNAGRHDRGTYQNGLSQDMNSSNPPQF